MQHDLSLEVDVRGGEDFQIDKDSSESAGAGSPASHATRKPHLMLDLLVLLFCKATLVDSLAAKFFT